MVGKLDDQISHLIAGLHWRIETDIKAQSGAAVSSLEQVRVLAVLAERNGRTVSDLAQAAFLELPTMSKMIDRMVADTLVYRTPDAVDRRRILIFATDRGLQRHQQLAGRVAVEEGRIRRHLGPRRTASLVRLLRDLSQMDIEPERPSDRKPLEAPDVAEVAQRP